MRRMILATQAICLLAMIYPYAVKADQTDARLESLFITLQTSQNPEELMETESSIWEIWFDSGKEAVDRVMDEAGVSVQSGNLAYAEALYSQVVEMAPDFSEGWNRRATVRYYMKDYDGSLDDIERTLLLEPRHFGATWGLGMILGLKRDYDGAIAAFERLLELKPNAQDARMRIELLKEELIKSAV